MRFKPLDQQTIVLTGATSGIGLVTVRRLAAHGANLVIAARNGEALETVARGLREQGARVATCVADVGDEGDVERIAEQAIRTFGGFDTWINNAGVAIYGRIDEVDTEDMRRLFDTNFWGTVYGCRAAVNHFRARGRGKLINIGSVLGDRSIPLQGPYSSSKAAVRGFTEALRSEMDVVDARVSITLIKPSAINTPYKEHAKNYLDRAPQNPPPVYEPETVARAILYACTHDVRDLVVGGGGKIIVATAALAPRLADRILGLVMPGLQKSTRPPAPRRDNSLYRPGRDGEQRSEYPFTFKTSAYTQAVMHPGIAAAAAVAASAGIAALVYARGGDGPARRGRAPARGYAPPRGYAPTPPRAAMIPLR